MALEPKELFNDGGTPKPALRSFAYEGGLAPGTLASITGAPTLPHLTPLAYDAGNSVWNVWDNATAAIDQIEGFLFAPSADDVVASATGEIHVQILRRGQVHRDDIPVPTTASQSQGTLDTALGLQALRTLGLDIRGLVNIH